MTAILTGFGLIFSAGAYFILAEIFHIPKLEEGKILVADPASKSKSEHEWNFEIILNEARKGAGAGGPFWIIS